MLDDLNSLSRRFRRLFRRTDRVRTPGAIVGVAAPTREPDPVVPHDGDEAMPAEVMEASRELVRHAEAAVREIPFAVDRELPGPGMVRLALLTRRGARAVVKSIEERARDTTRRHAIYLAADNLYRAFVERRLV